MKGFAQFLDRKQGELNDGKALLTYLYLPIQRMIAYDSLLKVRLRGGVEGDRREEMALRVSDGVRGWEFEGGRIYALLPRC